jgi:hypothetical protein
VSREWHASWDQEETWAFLQTVIATDQGRGMRYLVMFWDHSPWHVAASVRREVAAHNRAAK